MSKHPTGKRYTRREKQDIIDVVLALLATGKGTKRACKVAGVDQSTFWRWRKESDELAALTDQAIAGNVTAIFTAQLREACGYNYTEDTSQLTESGQLIITKRVTKHCRASVPAADLWLRNRDKDYVQRMPEVVNTLDLEKLRKSLKPPPFKKFEQSTEGAG